MKPESQEQQQPPRIRIIGVDPRYGGLYRVRCECGRVWDAWVDAVPYVECPNCLIRVESKALRDQKREERWR